MKSTIDDIQQDKFGYKPGNRVRAKWGASKKEVIVVLHKLVFGGGTWIALFDGQFGNVINKHYIKSWDLDSSLLGKVQLDISPINIVCFSPKKKCIWC